ncbi:endonuclease III domain-containing protein [Sediminicurvatus halobius]|uniref:Endonuclease n=1 Tax=Sediminicurvatus halobius TaxID=2182432 RepID=A0A2U2N3E5_9GAMM|nr:endonuclease [Spiribacter halobius]PWG63489.1 endonuclease [Spiribacter halobius]UEX79640.1 endonuclease [Spiribacter halobius]
MSGGRGLHDTYRRLHAAFGPQGWWPGETAFEVLVGAVLTQNAAWSNVERAIQGLRNACLFAPERIVAAEHGALAAAIRPSGYFNVKARRLRAACEAWLEHGGEAGLARLDTATLRARLLAVKGLGRESVDDVVLYAFERPVFVVDAYTRRIFSRLGVLAGDEPYETIRARFEAALPQDPALFNEYHALIVALGKDICRPRRPRCDECPLQAGCAFAGGP